MAKLTNNNKASPRAKGVMYVQYLDHLGFDSVEALISRIRAIGPREYALVVHDKDRNPDGSLKAPHVHVAIMFSSYRHLSAIAKDLNDKPQYVERWKGKFNNAYLYLVHKTANAVDKYQYDSAEVESNFDFEGFVNQQVNSFNKSKQLTENQKIDLVLDKLDRGELSYQQALLELSGSEYSKAYNRLTAVWQRVKERESKKWVEEMRRSHKTVKVLYFYGKSGTGKTRSALEYLQKHYADDEIYFSGSNRDPFQGYQFEKAIVLDDLRPNSIAYVDLLKLLDPYVKQSVAAGSRYSDKYLMAETIIITTPFRPDELFSAQRINKSIDGFDQLERRITACMHFTEKSIIQIDMSHFDANGYSPNEIGVIDSIPNKYADTNGAEKPMNFISELRKEMKNE